MEAQQYWKAFLDSGIPEYYLLYNHARKLESADVCDNQGAGSESVSLQ